MTEFVDELGEETLGENELLSADPQAALPSDLQRHCLNTIQKQFRQQRIQRSSATVKRKASRVLRYAAATIAVVSLLFTTAFAAVPEFRNHVLNLVVQTYEDSTDYTLGGGPSTPIHKITAGWLPEGYELVDESTTPTIRTNLYQTEDGKEIEISVSDLSACTVSLDTEDAVVTEITVNGHTGTTIFKKGLDGYGEPYERSVVVWFDETNNWLIEVFSKNESVETLMQVAKDLTVK